MMKLVLTQNIAKSSLHGCHVNDVKKAVNEILSEHGLHSLNSTTTVELKETIIAQNAYDNEQCNVMSKVTVTSIGDVHPINTLTELLGSGQYMKYVLPLSFRAPTPCGNATITLSPYEADQDQDNNPYIFAYVLAFVVLLVLACFFALCCLSPFVDNNKDRNYEIVNEFTNTNVKNEKSPPLPPILDFTMLKLKL